MGDLLIVCNLRGHVLKVGLYMSVDEMFSSSVSKWVLYIESVKYCKYFSSVYALHIIVLYEVLKDNTPLGVKYT